MKGIILAGGKATRLYPITKGICKQLIPIYDKPLIYYPLSILMLAGIRDILLISNSQPDNISRFKDLLKDGKDLGIKISYAIQEEPRGIAESFIIGKNFIGRDNVCLILGDNIFYGRNLGGLLKESASLKKGGVIFGYKAKNPKRYGVIEFDRNRDVVSIEEKPQNPKSNWVTTGIYFYDNEVVRMAKSLKPSGRGELEITDLNNEYLKRGELKVHLLGDDYTWLDTGTYDSLIEASIFIRSIEKKENLKVGSIEEVAYKMGYIDKKGLETNIKGVSTSYADYLKKILEK